MTERTELPANRRTAAALWLALWRTMCRADRGRLIIAAVVMLGASGLTAILPVLIGRLVDGSLRGGHVTLAGAAAPLATIGGLVIAGQLLQVVRRQLVESVATGLERDVRTRTYRHLFRQDLDVLRRGQIGSLYGRANRSIEGAVKLLKLGAMDLLPAVSLAISALIVAFAKNPLVASAMALVVPTGFGLVLWQVRNQAGVRLEIRDHKEAIDGDVVEKLPAMETIRANGAEDHLVAHIGDATARLRRVSLRHHRAMSLFDAAKAINEGLWLVATVAVAVQLAARGSISAGEVTTYILLFAAVTAPLRELHRIVDEAAESAQQTCDLFDLLDLPEDEAYLPVAGESPAAPARSAASFTDVTFAHERGGPPVIRGVSLDIARGERIGLVGRSGCGKSTLLKLIARLHHGYGGAISFEGRDLREISRTELNALVGYMPQDARLFKGTIRENIVLGAAHVTDKDVLRAARRANVHEDIVMRLGGYDGPVAERGENLSGGQRQRISLARTLLRSPSLLLLDEPTSALDGPSQAAVREAIDSLLDVTLIVVAHRLDTLETMDRILVMDEGRIVSELGAGDPRRGRADRWLAQETPATAARATTVHPHDVVHAS